MILDASVAAKWFLPDEELVVEARAVRSTMLAQTLALSAPAVLWTELAQAIVRAVRRDRIDDGQAMVLANDLLDVQPLVDIVAVDPRDTIRTALSVGVGAYDAQYLAASARLASSLITADRRMYDQGRAHGYDIVWLGDISTEEGVLVDTPQGYPPQGVG